MSRRVDWDAPSSRLQSQYGQGSQRPLELDYGPSQAESRRRSSQHDVSRERYPRHEAPIRSTRLPERSHGVSYGSARPCRRDGRRTPSPTRRAEREGHSDLRHGAPTVRYPPRTSYRPPSPSDPPRDRRYEMQSGIHRRRSSSEQNWTIDSNCASSPLRPPTNSRRGLSVPKRRLESAIQLPVELWLQIGQYCSLSCCSALARVSRKLFRVFVGVMWRELRFTLPAEFCGYESLPNLYSVKLVLPPKYAHLVKILHISPTNATSTFTKALAARTKNTLKAVHIAYGSRSPEGTRNMDPVVAGHRYSLTNFSFSASARQELSWNHCTQLLALLTNLVTLQLHSDGGELLPMASTQLQAAVSRITTLRKLKLHLSLSTLTGIRLASAILDLQVTLCTSEVASVLTWAQQTQDTLTDLELVIHCMTGTNRLGVHSQNSIDFQSGWPVLSKLSVLIIPTGNSPRPPATPHVLCQPPLALILFALAQSLRHIRHVMYRYIDNVNHGFNLDAETQPLVDHLQADKLPALETLTISAGQPALEALINEHNPITAHALLLTAAGVYICLLCKRAYSRMELLEDHTYKCPQHQIKAEAHLREGHSITDERQFRVICDSGPEKLLQYRVR